MTSVFQAANTENHDRKRANRMVDPELHACILSHEHKIWNAVIRKDGALLAQLFSDDYIEITLDGERLDKSKIVTMSPKVDEDDHY